MISEKIFFQFKPDEGTDPLIYYNPPLPKRRL